jgi:Putative auto-transporter adhesin, head GIN domain
MARILTVSILVFLLAGCSSVTGSGNLVTQEFDLDGFTRIEASHGAQVEVTLSEKFSVVVEVDDNVKPMLDVSVSGDTLLIGLNVDSAVNVTYRVQVTMPELTGITASGGSRIEGAVAGGDLAVAAGGNMTITASGGSRVTLTGTVARLTIEASGGSQVLLSGLAAGDVGLSASGGSRVEVNSSGQVSGQASGGASVAVSGSPASVDVQTSGGASVKTQ